MDTDRAAAVAERFKLGHFTDAAFAARGAMGAIFRLTTTTGEWAVKELFEWADAPAYPVDVDIQLAARAVGVPLPRPVIVDDNAIHTIDGGRYRVYEWLDLQPVERPIPIQRVEEAGRLLGLIHSLRFPLDDESVDEWFTTAPRSDTWAALHTRVSATDTALAARLVEQQSTIDDLGMMIEPHTAPPTVCHRDFEPDNVPQVAPDGTLHVLDWENAGPLAPDRELASSLLDWCADVDTADAFVSAYRRAGGVATTVERGSFSTAVATRLNFLKVQLELMLDDPAHRDYARDEVNVLLTSELPTLASRIACLLEVTQHG